MTTLNLQVGASTDDCWRRLASSSFNTTATWSEVGDFASDTYDYSAGLRFQNVTIGQGDTIDAATMQFLATDKNGAIPTTYIEGEDVDDAATFTTLANYDGRARTSAVSWTPGAWGLFTWYTSSEIKTIIQTIIDRGGWSSGNALVTFWRDADGWGGTQARLFTYAYDTSTTECPKLDIDYSAGAANVTVTPPTLALSLSLFASTILTPVLITPTTLGLSSTLFAPTVSTPRLVTPPALSLSLTPFASTVSTPRLVTPGVLAITLSPFAPAVSIGEIVTPSALALILSEFAPTVSTPRLVTPPALALVLSAFAPTVTVTGDVAVTPGVVALTLATFAPTVLTPTVVTPGVVALSLAAFAPTITIAAADVAVTPGVIALILTAFAPTVTVAAISAVVSKKGRIAPLKRPWIPPPPARTLEPVAMAAIATFWTIAIIDWVLAVEGELAGRVWVRAELSMIRDQDALPVVAHATLEGSGIIEYSVPRLQRELEELLERERETEEEVLLGL